MLVLYLFLRRIGTTLVAALGIPLTLLATCGVLLMRGEELNCIVLLGLVLGVGMLVDNAVVIVEAIEHHAALGAPPLQANRTRAWCRCCGCRPRCSPGSRTST